MGLDSYFRDADGDLAVGFPAVNLCGGMLSGNGSDGSFRGKVYNDLVERITGVSLYEERIEAETVAMMADELEYYVDSINEKPDDLVVDQEWDVSLRELRDLARLFRFAADNNLVLIGWW